jgi:hypothetical protein
MTTTTQFTPISPAENISTFNMKFASLEGIACLKK